MMNRLIRFSFIVVIYEFCLLSNQFYRCVKGTFLLNYFNSKEKGQESTKRMNSVRLVRRPYKLNTTPNESKQNSFSQNNIHYHPHDNFKNTQFIKMLLLHLILLLPRLALGHVCYGGNALDRANLFHISL